MLLGSVQSVGHSAIFKRIVVAIVADCFLFFLRDDFRDARLCSEGLLQRGTSRTPTGNAVPTL